MKMPHVTRRRFLVQSAAALAFPTIIPASAIGRGRPAPSERITVGAIGYGTIALDWTPNFLNNDKCQFVAVADPMKQYGHYGYRGEKTGGREAGRKIIDQHYSESERTPKKACTAYADFRELLDKEDLDAVQISTPDHWHAYLAILAAGQGKHIYGQKPLSLTIDDGRRMVDAVTKSGVTWQTGSQQRSDQYFRMACELVRNGRIGNVKRVRIGLPGGHTNWNQMGDQTDPAPLPPDFDYEMWLGPAPEMEYRPAMLPLNWRHNFNFSGGMITDFGAHHIDIAQWAMDTERTGPVEINNIKGDMPAPDALYNTATAFHFEAVFADGLTFVIADESEKLMPEPNAANAAAAEADTKNKMEDHVGILFEGENDQWIYVNRGKIQANDREILRQKIEPGEVYLYESKDHSDNFLSCIYDGQPTAAPVEIAHRTISIAHLGNIGLRLGRKQLKWDPDTEQILGDDAANAMLKRQWRKPWVL